LGGKGESLMNSNDRDRKKEWKLEQKQLARAAFPMSDALLESLFEAVDSRVAESGCDHTLRFTKQWIAEHRQAESPVLDWLKEHGGFCDCEVVANAADHWEQNQ
jgi:hypothetical protein